MDLYRQLTIELMEAFSSKQSVPPKDKIGESIRGEMAVLRLLGEENRQIAAGEISRMLNMTTSRIAAVLGTLEKKGYITRQTDKEDKRRVLAGLTEKGFRFHEQKKEEAYQHMQQLLSRLGEDDAREYVRLVKRIFEILPEIEPQEKKTVCDQK